jgi:predicted phosphodiesterase
MSDKIFYAGDIHGHVKHVAEIDIAAAKAGATYVVQVGDFGIRWPGGQCSIFKYFEKRARKTRAGPTWITCGGNHDNWDKWNQLSAEQGHPDLVELAPGCFFAQRGSTHTLGGLGHLFCGGAESTDKHVRSVGVDWWAAETPTYSDFTLFMDRMEADKPDIIVTHDAPSCVSIKRTQRDQAPTPRNLNNVLLHSSHKPKVWYFGHHHRMDEWEIEGVLFRCCGLHGQYKVS